MQPNTYDDKELHYGLQIRPFLDLINSTEAF